MRIEKKREREKGRQREGWKEGERREEGRRERKEGVTFTNLGCASAYPCPHQNLNTDPRNQITGPLASLKGVSE